MIVNSVNKSLDLGKGFLFKVIVMVVGLEVVEECWWDYLLGVIEGNVVVSFVGKLKCKIICYVCVFMYN